MPDSQMNLMGAEAFQQIKSSTPIEKKSALNDYVRCVAFPITQAAQDQLSIKDWEIVVFKDDSANAFALPGGKIGVHTGILPVAKTDAQLAAVLGHEVGHVIARHGNERVSEAFATQGGLTVIGALTPDNPKRNLILGLLGIGTQFGILLPHSRTQESEADLIGLKLMAKAGFNPKESLNLWHNMSEATRGKAPPEWLSTHPANPTRISNLQTHMPEAIQEYQRAQSAGKSPHCALPH